MYIISLSILKSKGSTRGRGELPRLALSHGVTPSSATSQPYPGTPGADDSGQVRTFPSFKAKVRGPGGPADPVCPWEPDLSRAQVPLTIAPGRTAVRHKQGPGHPALLPSRSRKQSQVWGNPRTNRRCHPCSLCFLSSDPPLITIITPSFLIPPASLRRHLPPSSLLFTQSLNNRSPIPWVLLDVWLAVILSGHLSRPGIWTPNPSSAWCQLSTQIQPLLGPLPSPPSSLLKF